MASESFTHEVSPSEPHASNKSIPTCFAPVSHICRVVQKFSFMRLRVEHKLVPTRHSTLPNYSPHVVDDYAQHAVVAISTIHDHHVCTCQARCTRDLIYLQASSHPTSCTTSSISKMRLPVSARKASYTPKSKSLQQVPYVSSNHTSGCC